ncbi:MAG: PadR family transcriptional regulator [Chloroflexota bacterium]
MQSPLSALGSALLGLLARDSLSGYDLFQRMKAPIGFFWSARHSQIYPELAKLETRGLIAHTVVEQDDRPDKKVYRLTERGRMALVDWLLSPLIVSAPRDEMVLRVYSLWLIAPARALTFVRAEAARHRDQLARYQDFQATLEQIPAAQTIGSQTFATYATLRRGLGYEREYADWCDWLTEQLESATGDEVISLGPLDGDLTADVSA